MPLNCTAMMLMDQYHNEFGKCESSKHLFTLQCFPQHLFSQLYLVYAFPSQTPSLSFETIYVFHNVTLTKTMTSMIFTLEITILNGHGYLLYSRGTISYGPNKDYTIFHYDVTYHNIHYTCILEPFNNYYQILADGRVDKHDVTIYDTI